jgi:periplasmic divalent cation tolerance protein
MAAEHRVVLCTCPTSTVAAEIATALIEQNLAACVNRIGGIKSWYRWDGQLRQDEEVLLLIKTTAPRLAEVEEAIVKLHPYDVPEIVALPIVAGSAAYLQWLERSVQA